VEKSMLAQGRALDAALLSIKQCGSGLGQCMNQDMARKFEALPWLFPDPPTPRGAARRAHYSVREVWSKVWHEISLHPSLGASTMEGILAKFQYVQTLHQ
jgi:hypothetical protein